MLGPCGVTFWIVFGKREHLFAYSFAGPFWSGSGACFGLQTMILGSVLGGFWVGLGPGKSCQSVQLYAFSGFGPFWCGVRFGICFWKGSGMHSCEILAPIRTPIGAPFGYFCQLFQGLILEAVLGRQNEAKNCKSGWGRGGPAAGAGPAKLAFARSWNWSCTPSAMPEAWGSGFRASPTAAGPCLGATA